MKRNFLIGLVAAIVSLFFVFKAGQMNGSLSILSEIETQQRTETLELLSMPLQPSEELKRALPVSSAQKDDLILIPPALSTIEIKSAYKVDTSDGLMRPSWTDIYEFTPKSRPKTICALAISGPSAGLRGDYGASIGLHCF